MSEDLEAAGTEKNEKVNEKKGKKEKKVKKSSRRE